MTIASGIAANPAMSGSWSRVARRIRVPLGFAFAVLYLWLARPTWLSMAAGAAVIICGLALRAAASGHVRKNAELTTTGPYAYTRNPLYLGSLLIAVGFAIAARSLWVVIAIVVLFFAIYLPVIRSEEDYLRATFPGFDDYARAVPRLIPRTIPRTSRAADPAGGRFSPELYRKHREYNALIGAAALMLALAAKIIWNL
jgi:protein-S-isoprenylcysteine O-methyltransferase Ste14